MRTRRGSSYHAAAPACLERPTKRPRTQSFSPAAKTVALSSTSSPSCSSGNPFDALPDDLLLSIFALISSRAASPADLISARLTCRRFNSLVTQPSVLCKASLDALTVKASRWCHGALQFLRLCAESGNIEACYTLGMILFYCLQSREEGMVLLWRAAKASHAAALHSLAVIQFNGSGGAKKQKNLKAGVGLCMRAAAKGHIDGMRELGHCLQDGYGIARNVLEGRRLLLEANAREAAAAVTSSLGSNVTESTLQLTATKIAIGCFRHHFLSSSSSSSSSSSDIAKLSDAALPGRHPIYTLLQSGGCSLLSDFGCNVPPPKLHVANQFMAEWHRLNPPEPGLRLCSHDSCGRLESRRHEFRRCSACANVNYCSRACQALDWKLRHKFACATVAAAVGHPRPAAINLHADLLPHDRYQQHMEG